MKLFATVASERATKGQGGNEILEINAKGQNGKNFLEIEITCNDVCYFVKGWAIDNAEHRSERFFSFDLAKCRHPQNTVCAKCADFPTI